MNSEFQFVYQEFAENKFASVIWCVFSIFTNQPKQFGTQPYKNYKILSVILHWCVYNTCKYFICQETGNLHSEVIFFCNVHSILNFIGLTPGRWVLLCKIVFFLFLFCFPTFKLGRLFSVCPFLLLLLVCKSVAVSMVNWRVHNTRRIYIAMNLKNASDGKQIQQNLHSLWKKGFTFLQTFLRSNWKDP